MRYQEAGGKDVERAFGVLQSKWYLIARLSRFLYKETMHNIMRCCFILHNVIVESRIVDDSEEHDKFAIISVTVDPNMPPV